MVAIRFLLIVFNVAVVTFLIYRIFTVTRQPIEKSKKIMIVIGGCLLLLAPFGMFFGIFGASPQYFVVYPVAISLFLYLTKQL